MNQHQNSHERLVAAIDLGSNSFHLVSAKISMGGIRTLTKDREKVRKTVGARNMIEIYINTSLKECEHRDVKGLYKKARQGEIKNMTGISAPYEAPKKPEIEIKTEELSVENAAKKITNYLSLKLALQNE